jgi:cytochrome o ubiquinol oxidase subunit IV
MAEIQQSLEFGTGKKTLFSYSLGFILCILLTVVAFGLVQFHLLPQSKLGLALMGLAVIQFLVQAVCFLRLNSNKEGLWNLLPFLFIILIIFIIVAGSLWVMQNLNYNMAL